MGQVVYTPWCDEHGKVIDDGTVSRLEENTYRWTAADPSLRWFTQNANGMDVHIEDISESVAALALQGPTSGRLLKALVTAADIENLKYFRVTTGVIAGVPVEISRTGYTGDSGCEIWVAADQALRVWDALMESGQALIFIPPACLRWTSPESKPASLLIEVDFNSSKKALIDEQKYSPFEMGLGRLVHTNKNRFIGQAALIAEQKLGSAREIVGLEIDWPQVEQLYERVGLPPAVSPIASRVAVPVFKDGTHVGKATSSTWSPTLKR